VFTGSSLLHIIQGHSDLSRKAVSYLLDGLSFREYEQIQTGELFELFSLEKLLKNHMAIAEAILEKIKPFEYFFNPTSGMGFILIFCRVPIPILLN